MNATNVWRVLVCVGLQILAAQCWATPVEIVEKTERGALTCTEMVERRRVNNYWWELFANGKPFIPEGRDTNKVGTCMISRNPAAQVFVFILGENLFRFQIMEGKPVAIPIQGPPGRDSIQQMKTAVWSCNGDCLIWPGHLVSVKTGEIKKLAMPELELDLIGISPDLQTVVAESPDQVDQNAISLVLIDTATGKTTPRILNKITHAWLLDRREGVEAVAAKFKWQRRSNKDQLVFPN